MKIIQKFIFNTFAICMLHIYGLEGCKNCEETIKMFKKHKIPFQFYDIKKDTMERWKLQFIMEEEGKMVEKVPQILTCNNTHIGGYDEIKDLAINKELQKQLEEEGVPYKIT